MSEQGVLGRVLAGQKDDSDPMKKKIMSTCQALDGLEPLIASHTKQALKDPKSQPILEKTAAEVKQANNNLAQYAKDNIKMKEIKQKEEEERKRRELQEIAERRRKEKEEEEKRREKRKRESEEKKKQKLKLMRFCLLLKV